MRRRLRVATACPEQRRVVKQLRRRRGGAGESRLRGRKHRLERRRRLRRRRRRPHLRGRLLDGGRSLLERSRSLAARGAVRRGHRLGLGLALRARLCSRSLAGSRDLRGAQAGSVHISTHISPHLPIPHERAQCAPRLECGGGRLAGRRTASAIAKPCAARRARSISFSSRSASTSARSCCCCCGCGCEVSRAASTQGDRAGRRGGGTGGRTCAARAPSRRRPRSPLPGRPAGRGRGPECRAA